MGDLKEIYEVYSSRLKSPIFGCFVLSFLVVNWKVVFYLFFSDAPAELRITYFDSHTTMQSLLCWPLFWGAFGVLAYPWINYVFLVLGAFAKVRQNRVQASSESDYLYHQQKLSEQRKRDLNQHLHDQKLEIIRDAEAEERLKKLSPENQVKVRERVDSVNEKTVLDQPIERQYLANYLTWKWPNLEANERVEELFLQHINKSKYKKIRDIDENVMQAGEFLKSYSYENPEVFKSGIDYVTKAFGYLDQEFFNKHNFSKKTKNAIANFSSNGS